MTCAKGLQQLSKTLLKKKEKNKFSDLPKEERAVRLQQAWRSTGPVDRRPAGKEPLGFGRLSGRPSFLRKHSFLLPIDRSVDSNKPRADWLQSVDRPVDRQTYTNRACPDTGAGRLSGRPVSPETEKQAEFEVRIFL